MEKSTDKNSSETSKVVSLFGKQKVDTASLSSEDTSPAEEGASAVAKESAFLQEMRRNMENAERIKKERLKANQGVLKSYRIKN